MNIKLNREEIWLDRQSMSEFLEEPLNQKVYEEYLSIKRKSYQKRDDTLSVFNEVYYLCSRVVHENDNHPCLDYYIQDIRERLGWDYSTSLVLQMVYAVLALRRGNTEAVNRFVDMIYCHYHMGERKIPFGVFVEDAKKKGLSYDIDFNTSKKTSHIIDLNDYLAKINTNRPHINI